MRAGGAYFDAGLDGLIFNMHDAQDLEPVRLAGETLAERSPEPGVRLKAWAGRSREGLGRAFA